MNREDIIRMAMEAGFGNADAWPDAYPNFERFAALVAIHVWAQQTTAAQILEAVAAEREACEKVCENIAKGYEERSQRPEKDRDINPEVARIAVMTCGFVESAIRARGNT
jgi:hypothetical protein